MGPLGKRLSWPNEVMCIIEGYLRRPTPLCMAVGEVIREMGAEDVTCHCDCQNCMFRFELELWDNTTVLVNDRACRQGLLHARSLDPGLDLQEYRNMMRHLEVDFRAVMYMANLKDEDDFMSALDYAHFTPHVTARTWEEVGQWVHLATMRPHWTMWS